MSETLWWDDSWDDSTEAEARWRKAVFKAVEEMYHNIIVYIYIMKISKESGGGCHSWEGHIPWRMQTIRRWEQYLISFMCSIRCLYHGVLEFGAYYGWPIEEASSFHSGPVMLFFFFFFALWRKTIFHHLVPRFWVIFQHKWKNKRFKKTKQNEEVSV